MRTPYLKTGLLLLTLSACNENKTPPPEPTPATPPPAMGSQQATPPPTTPPPATPPPAESAPASTGAEHAASPAPRTQPPGEKPGPWQQKALAGQDLYATLVTSQGNIVVKLFSKDAPVTVANFVGLSNGEQAWTDPRTGQAAPAKKPLYQDVIFHRIIPGFMIQGGDALGTGTGSPGYGFEDEVSSGRGFDKPGLLAMANRGGGTRSNGSQFFITVSTPTYLNGRHTIFGEVVKGYDIVQAMSQVQTGPGDKPVKDVVLKKVTLSEAQPK
jgi:peptidyl-prolyl cis-trans isomerase A (cyclophilin A)